MSAHEVGWAAVDAAGNLEMLYTEHVIPEGMLGLWNDGLGRGLRHRVRDGEEGRE